MDLLPGQPSKFVRAHAIATPQIKRTLLALAALAAGYGLATAVESAVGGTAPPAVQEVRDLLVGNFSSTQQAAADPDYADVHLHIRQIWPGREDGPWLYVEQGLATALEKPYRQRIYQLATLPDDRVKSSVFTLPEPARFVGAWRDPERFASVTPAELKLREGCSVWLAPTGADGSYAGSTGGNGCASDLRGAAYATSVVTLDRHSFASWDRGFDASDTQVWGAKNGPYIFRRIPPENGP